MEKVFADKKWLIFTACFAIMLSMQGSYIGNTTASQAVKAGSTPVPCSKSTRKRAFFIKARLDSVFLRKIFKEVPLCAKKLRLPAASRFSRK